MSAFGSWRQQRWRIVAASVLSVVLSCLAGSVHALGLGEIELESNLNERLRATIELYDAEGLATEEIIVSLGSSDDFERVGVERFYFLTTMRFEVIEKDGVPVIEVRSSQPISEPYLNFLVEVLWPQGRLLKEYTLLLDPPTYSATVAPPVTESPPAPARAPIAAAPAPRATPPSPPPRNRSGRVELPSASNQGPSGSRRDAGMTSSDDTLWSIASRHKPANVSMNQYMLAVQRANPEAFISGNINLMKAGYVLRLPDANESGALSIADAAAEVAQQNDAWRAYRRGDSLPSPTQVADTQSSGLRSQVDATPTPSPSTSRPDAQSGRLQIVAGEGDAVQGSTSGDANAALAAEENDRLQREVDELRYELDQEREMATNQIAVKDRQIEVKDQQLAELREQLEQARSQLAQAQSNPDAAVPQSPQQSTTQSDGAWWQNPLVLGALGGVLLLALLVGLFVVRRRQQAEQEQAEYLAALEEDAADEAEDPLAEAEADAEEQPLFTDDELDALDEEEDSFSLGDELAEEDLEVPEPEAAPSLQTSDVIGEADIYAAYGRYPHAVGLLLGALEEDPDRHDVRLKLLEVCVAAQDRETFDTHMTELMERCDDQDVLLTAREFEEAFPSDDAGGATAFAAPAAAAAAAALVSAEDAAAEETAVLDESQADTEVEDTLAAPDDEQTLDALIEEDLDQATELADEDVGDFLDDLDLDDELDDLDGLDELAAPAAALSDDTLASSLSADETTEALADETAETLVDAGDELAEATDDALDDFDLDFDDDELGDAEAAIESVTDDFDLSLDDDDTPVAMDSPQEDVLGGDLGLDFDPDETATDEAVSREPEDHLSDAEQALGLSDDSSDTETTADDEDLFADVADDAEIDDLLAELDAETDASSGSGGFADEDDFLADIDAELEGDLEDLSDATDATDATDSGAEESGADILAFNLPSDDEGDEFDFGDDGDSAETKLDLAQAYIDMGDKEGARDILSEVLQEGNEDQRSTAQGLLDELAS